MKKFFTSAVLLAAALFTANAQQLQTGDQFTYTNAEGVEKTYIVTGENLIENPSFDNNTTGWVGGGGGNLTGVDWHNSGGVDGGAYLRLTENAGKGGNGSIGTAWALEKGKTYVFSYYIRQNTSTDAVAKEGYIVTSETNTPRGDESKTIMYAYEDADCAWTQNIVVTTAEYDYLQFCARWLGGSKCFDAFILAEISEVADPAELEQLLTNCQEWMGVYDEPKGQETLQTVVDKAQNVLDNFENYTSDEVNAMVHELKEALLDYRVVNASDEYPVDVTARYLKNPNFDNGLSDWVRNNDAVEGGSNIRFFEYFGESSRVLEINEGTTAVSKDTHVSQTVYNLPMGYYRFTVQCVMNHSVDTSDPEAKSGAAIYCNGSELDMVTKEITTDGAGKDASYPETFTIEGIVSADSITVGFVGYQTNNFTYVAIDNVKLEYAGFDAGIYIDQLVSEVLDWIGDNGDYLLPAIALALEEETALAEDALSGTEEEMNAAYKQLDAAFAKAKESVKLMEQLEKDYMAFAEFVAETNYDGADAANAFIDEVAAFLELQDEEASYDELDAMIAKLQQAQNDYRLSQKATKEEPADYTFFIPNANFEEKGNWVWTVTHSGGGTDTWVGGCRPAMEGGENRQGVNLWGNHLTSLDLHQELTGLPNGLYGISAELITQGETTDHGDYTTDQHLYVTGINTAVSENLPAPGGWDFYQWSTLKTPYVVVIDGTLTIGAATNTFGEAAEGWFQATNFKLQYYGPASDEDFKVAYEASLVRANEYIAILLPGDSKEVTAAIAVASAMAAKGKYADACQALSPTVAAYDSIYNVTLKFHEENYQTLLDLGYFAEELGAASSLQVVEAAIAFADAALAAENATHEILEPTNTKLGGYVAYVTYLIEVENTIPALKGLKAEHRNYMNETVIAPQVADLLAKFRTAADCEYFLAKLKKAMEGLESSLYGNLSAGDLTLDLIKNSTFDTNADGWIIRQGNGNGPTITGEHYTGDAENRYMDSWNGTTGALNFTAYQEIFGLPDGIYQLTVATRTDGDNVYVFAAPEPLEEDTAKWTAATQWAMIPNHGAIHGGIYDADNFAYENGDIVEPTPIMNANGGQGYGWSYKTINVEVTRRYLAIGITANQLLTGKSQFTGTWLGADDWKLVLLEKAAVQSEFDPFAGIEDVETYAMTAQDVVAEPSSIVNIPIELKNSTAVTAFQFDLYLPEGVSPLYDVVDGEIVYDVTFNTDRTRYSHVLAASVVSDGALRVVAYSTEDAPFIGNEGVVVNVAVAVDDYVSARDYAMNLRNVRMVKSGVSEVLGANSTAILSVVRNTLMGDVNSDGKYSISDVVMVVNAVLEKPQANFNVAVADMNGDGNITMGDAILVLRLVLTDGKAMAPARSASPDAVPVLSTGDLAAMADGRVALPVALDNSEAYSAFQLDVVLPAGVELTEATLTGRAKASHAVAWNTLSDGKVRIVAYALDNAAFRGNEGTLLNLVLTASDEQAADAAVVLADGLFATVSGAEHRAEDVSVMMRSEATGVDALSGAIRVSGAEGAVVVQSAADAAISIYAMTGQLVQQAEVKGGESRIALPAGVYVINGNKITVK